jgi:hypothetical protein
MNAKNIILNAALAIGLAATGSGFAADTPVTEQVQDRETIRAQHRAETANMTQEERDAYRAQKQSEMTAEQRAAMRATNGNKAGKGNGAKLRDGSGAGSQSRGSGAQGANAGKGMGR